ncbi:hypothetical protein FQN57_000161 [Myotisia sp. PD_48]|nr:hypothetical protein FQN57_000161 [Myotisia sp. PD_48]
MAQHSEDKLWLRAQAHKLGLSDLTPDDRLKFGPLPYTGISTPADSQKAEEFLKRARQTREADEKLKKIKKSSLLSSKKNKFRFEDYSKALKEVVENDDFVGVAKVLYEDMKLQQPTKTKTSRFSPSKLPDEDELDSLMYTVLYLALSFSNIRMIEYFSSVVKAKELIKLLPVTLETCNIAGATILLQYGADANCCRNYGYDLMKKGMKEFIRLLLRAPKPLSPDVITAILPKAVEADDVEFVQILLLHSADANDSNGAALRIALQANNYAICLALLLAPKPPAANTLGSLIEEIFSRVSLDDVNKYQLIELLLHGGATGVPIAKVLVGSVRQRNIRLIKLLVSQGADALHNDAESFQLAASSCDEEVMNILNPKGLSSSLASKVFKAMPMPEIANPVNHDILRGFTEILLKQGATGTSVNSSLAYWVELRDLGMLRQLLKHGASVDYDEGKALLNAVDIEQLDLIDLLLDHNPNEQILSTIFPCLRQVSRQTRLHVTKKLVSAGVTGQAIHTALSDAIVQQSYTKDTELIDILVAGGADVSQSQGKLLQHVIQSSDVATLTQLLKQHCEPYFLAMQVPLAAKIPPEARYQILSLLLCRGAKGPEVSQAIIDSIEDSPSGVRTTRLLITSLNTGPYLIEAKAVQKAIYCRNIEYLTCLVDHGRLSLSVVESSVLDILRLPRGDSTRIAKLDLLISSGFTLSPEVGLSALYEEMKSMKASNSITTETLMILMSTGARVNFDDGLILRHCIDLDMVECFRFYLGYAPTAVSLKRAFERGFLYWRDHHDLSYMELLIPLKPDREVLNVVLVEAVNLPDNRELLVLLLENGADVNFKVGASLCIAIKRRHFLEVETILKYGKPEAITLNAAFDVSMDISNHDKRYKALNYVLKAGMTGLQLHRALISSAAEGSAGIKFCNLLLQHGASVNYQDGTALLRAITHRNPSISLVKMLVDADSSPLVVGEAIDCCFEYTTGKVQHDIMKLLLQRSKPQYTLDQILYEVIKRSPCDKTLAAILLENGASVHYRDGESVIHAAEICDLDTLRLLQSSIQGHQYLVSRAFKRSWDKGNWARTDNDLQILLLLLDAGAKGDCVDTALSESIRDQSHSKPISSLVHSLLQNNNINVNFEEGDCISAAIEMQKIGILQQLLLHNPSSSVISMRFPLVFSHISEPNLLQQFFETFCKHPEPPDFNYIDPIYGPVIYNALKHHPNEKNVLRELIDRGSHPDPVVLLSLKDSISSKPEQVSALCWAISQDKRDLDESVIEILVNAGANVNFSTSISGHTPLWLAILHSRRETIARLLGKGADIYKSGKPDKSCLQLACSRGELDIIKLLMKSGAEVDDGSLHEAARNVQVQVMHALIDNGHRADYPLSYYDGRTALAELCLMAEGKSYSELKVAIAILVLNGDFRLKSSGKSILHFALDNKTDALTVARVLLDTFMGSHLNEHFNIFEEDGLCYSPLAYVAKGVNQAPETETVALSALLKGFNCDMRFWASYGDQPDDAIGAPPEIAAAILERQRQQELEKAELLGHQRRLEFRRKEAEQELGFQKDSHSMAVAFSRERAEAAKQEAILQDEIRQHTYTAELNHFQQLSKTKIEQRKRENVLEIAHVKQVKMLEHTQIDLQHDSERAREKEKLEYLRNRERLLTWGIESRGEVAEKQFQNQMKLLQAQKQLMEAHAELQQSAPQFLGIEEAD